MVTRLAVLLAAVAFAPDVPGAQPVPPTRPADDPRTESLPRYTPPERQRAPVRPGIARYSPLAAAGGYQGQSRTWQDALFAWLNPHNIDWGAVWERRKENFRSQRLRNPYFWTCALLALACIALLFLLFVAVRDRRLLIAEGERMVRLLAAEADAAHRRAEEAIARHNAHVEHCNLATESLESGLPLPDPAEALRWRQDWHKVTAELAEKRSELVRVKAELDAERATVRTLGGRLQALEERPPNTNATLVERVNRLEAELRSKTDEIRKLRARAKPAATEPES